MSTDTGDSVIDALREALADPEKRHNFIDRMRERRGWKTYRIAQSRVCHWLDPEHASEFPAKELGEALRVLHHADFLEPLLALEAIELRNQRRKIRKVEPAAKRREEWAS